MKLTKESEKLMSMFIKNKCISHSKQTHKTDNVLRQLYTDMRDADELIEAEKRRLGNSFYKLKVVDFKGNGVVVPRPTTFNANSFPDDIKNHIDQNISKELSYTFSLFGRSIRIRFFVENSNAELFIDKYNEYVDKMLMWLYIVNEYASKQCATQLTIFIYFTDTHKQLPESNLQVLDQTNINTAFTYTCPVNSEIVVFRKEEWFKVFIHETFHNFALDFSDMSMDICNRKIKQIFDVESDINLFESYTEFWAKMLNSLFCSYQLLEDKTNEGEFLVNCEFFINFERTYGFFQLVKALDFMGLEYHDLYSKKANSKVLRDTMYKEKTNVLSYYIITMVLMNNYQLFIGLCNKNNLQLLQFKKTPSNLESFCDFIEKHYKTRSMLDGVKCATVILSKLKKTANKNATNQFALKNMRMTICELG